MSKTFTTEITRNIYDDSTGAYLQVSGDADSLGGLVRIFTPNTLSVQHFGSCNIVVEPAMAKLLAEAILDRVADIEKHGH